MRGHVYYIKKKESLYLFNNRFISVAGHKRSDIKYQDAKSLMILNIPDFTFQILNVYQ